MKNQKIISLIAGPTILIILAICTNGSKAGLTLGAGLWMIFWWVTEATSLFATSFLPIVLFPLLGISTIENTALSYGDPMIFLFLGGFMIALALEKTGLHRRFSFGILKYTGSSVRGLLLGFMISTAFLSMWISNTATTMLMLPIALSVIHIFQEQMAVSEKDVNNFSVSILLIISFASSIGGMATLIGTPPNIVFAGYMEKNEGLIFSFSDWLKIGLPVAVVMLALTYILITRVFYPVNLAKMAHSEEFEAMVQIKDKISPSERHTLIIFSITAFLWIFKDLINGVIPFKLNDPTIAMLGGLSLFVIPASVKKDEFALKWRDTKDLPFGILFLFGGGIALANSFAEAGIMKWIADQVHLIEFSKSELILILIVITVVLTEVMSNVALVIVFLPVVVALAKGLGINILSLAVPVTLAASSGFMLPMSTPPNAIIFGSGKIKIKDMMTIGLVLDILSVIIIFLAGYFLIPLIKTL